MLFCGFHWFLEFPPLWVQAHLGPHLEASQVFLLACSQVIQLLLLVHFSEKFG